VKALPELSTAAQKMVVGHETETRLKFGSMTTGGDQDVPLNVKAFPEVPLPPELPSTATQ
jgi:hypothetical protein